MDMHPRTVLDLANELKQRRRLGEPPPVLLLGAGASTDAGLADMGGIYRAANLPKPKSDDAFDRFCKYIEERNARERYLLLAQHLETADPFVVTPGYRALAALCAMGFFDVVLTANLDPLLDDALASAELRRRDYLLIVNGMIRPDLLGPMLGGSRPRLKVIKIHGDLFARQMAWTPAEMNSYLDGIWEYLWPAVRPRDFLIAGYSLRDKRVQDLVFSAEGTLWFTHPKKVPSHLLPLFMKHLARLRTVIGPKAAFEELFCGLAECLGVSFAPPPEQDTNLTTSRESAFERPIVASQQTSRRTAPAWIEAAHTLDDLMGAIVGVERESGEAVKTGFALAEPSVIVSDGYIGNTGLINWKKITLLTASGTKLVTRSLGIRNHPFGPIVLALPEEFRLPRLRLYTGALKDGMPVQVGVAAGVRRGIAQGWVRSATEKTVEVAPLGKVPNLIELECAIAPGSCGAPVVDHEMRVIGFIVAGSSNLENPTSYMYPARLWAEDLL